MPPKAKAVDGASAGIQKRRPNPAAARARPSQAKVKAVEKLIEEPQTQPEQEVQHQDVQPTTKRTVKKPAVGSDGMDDVLKPWYYAKNLTDPINTARDKWNLLPAFLKVKGLVKQHLDSFNYFTQVEIKQIVEANSMVISEQQGKYIQFTDIRVGAPCRIFENKDTYTESQVTPNECRLRDATYAAPIYVDYIYPKSTGKVAKTNMYIGRMPIMLRSANCVLSGKTDTEMASLNECSIDPGGYFIVRGQEKVILVQEQLSKNRVIVEQFKGVIQASVTSHTANVKTKTYVLVKKGLLVLKHNSLSEDIPIVIVLKAMGVSSDAEVFGLVAGRDALYQDVFTPNIEQATNEGVFTQDQALDYIAARLKTDRYGDYRKPEKSAKQKALDKLAFTILSHVRVTDLNLRPKALYMAFMARRVLMAMLDPKLIDDRDFLGNKRLELSGQLLSLLFEDLFKDFTRHLKVCMDKTLKKRNPTKEFDPYDHIASFEYRFTGGMERAIATGNWTLKRFRMDRAGISHVLSRLSYISALGMMTRITSQFEKTRKISGPRALQTSQFGMLCTSDTPEGEACGLVKNLALMTHITTQDDEEPIRNTIFSLGAESVTEVGGVEIYSEGAYVIFLNGTPVALTRSAKQFLASFRKFRRMGRISEFVSAHINEHHNGVHIATDEGRVCRPLIIVENGKSRLTSRFLDSLRKGSMNFDDALSRGIVEYLDVNEENDANIALKEEQIDMTTTHLEIEPFTILGAVAGLIPYPHHNQSPRNTYQCAMGKQAIGAIAYNQFSRIDTLLYLMVYPQKPLVSTRTIELVKYDKLPAGQNAIVAVMSYSGYDIEDALVLNKASCDRGFGRCQVFRKVNVLLKTYNNGASDRLAKHDEHSAKQSEVEGDGLIGPGAKLEAGKAFALKEAPIHTSKMIALPQQQWTKQHMSYKSPDPCMIDKVMVTTSESNAPVVKILTRQTRRPEIGDKFSSRHGQKGVVGTIVEEADMPFNDAGIRPDLIMNPHGFPSRMTVGKMIEMISGKAGVITGTQQYGTAFGGSKMDDMGEMLVRAGYSYSGKDMVTSGITGEPLPAYIFFGPIYYQKLKHMVADKMHSRATGPKAILTRQPTEGRSRAGGLRLGEMERDCLIAYGASQLLIERLMLSSDVHEVEVCETCGYMIDQPQGCRSCGPGGKMVPMQMPYAAKLLIQELMSMNISTQIKLVDKFPRSGKVPFA